MALLEMRAAKIGKADKPVMTSPETTLINVESNHYPPLLVCRRRRHGDFGLHK
jgi:hypothetical protein